MSEPCRHPNPVLKDLDPFGAIGARRYWCSECGAVSDRGRYSWLLPRRAAREGEKR